MDRASGSFNVCFFVAFGQDDEPEWVVRIPIEPALGDPWNKLLSEVTTLRRASVRVVVLLLALWAAHSYRCRYLERNTVMPQRHGRDAELTKTGARTQTFLVTDFVPGRPLDKRVLDEASEEHRRNLHSGLIDVLAELRRLEFPLIGSLMPNPDGSPDHPVLGLVISMSSNQVPTSTTCPRLVPQLGLDLDTLRGTCTFRACVSCMSPSLPTRWVA